MALGMVHFNDAPYPYAEPPAANDGHDGGAYDNEFGGL